MTAAAFKNSWTANGESLSPLSPHRLDGLNLLPSTAEFLIHTGLPEDAAPFLSFVQDNDEILNGINKLSDQYDFLGPGYESYIVIGSCGNGDPIAINTDNQDQIVRLDHEDMFSAHFFNSSILSLAECLLAYRNFIQAMQDENGEDAYMNVDFTNEQFETLKQQFFIADSRVLTEDGFWKEQLEMDLAERQEERDKKRFT